MTSPRKNKVISIQAVKRRGFKSSTSYLNAKTAASAHRSGMAWDDDEVARLVRGIENDDTTYDMALDLGRTLYGVMNARSHVGFALRHRSIILQASAKKKGKR